MPSVDTAFDGVTSWDPGAPPPRRALEDRLRQRRRTRATSFVAMAAVVVLGAVAARGAWPDSSRPDDAPAVATDGVGPDPAVIGPEIVTHPEDATVVVDSDVVVARIEAVVGDRVSSHWYIGDGPTSQVVVGIVGLDDATRAEVLDALRDVVDVSRIALVDVRYGTADLEAWVAEVRPIVGARGHVVASLDTTAAWFDDPSQPPDDLTTESEPVVQVLLEEPDAELERRIRSIVPADALVLRYARFEQLVR